MNLSIVMMFGNHPIKVTIFHFPKQNSQPIKKNVTIKDDAPLKLSLEPGPYTLEFNSPEKESYQLAAVSSVLGIEPQVAILEAEKENDTLEFRFTVPEGTPEPIPVEFSLKTDQTTLKVSGRVWETQTAITEPAVSSQIQGLQGHLKTITLPPGNYIYWFQSLYGQNLETEFELTIKSDGGTTKSKKYKHKEAKNLTPLHFSVP